jgi:hypothetical protein
MELEWVVGKKLGSSIRFQVSLNAGGKWQSCHVDILHAGLQSANLVLKAQRFVYAMLLLRYLLKHDLHVRGKGKRA